MGLFDKILGGQKKEYPPLDAGSDAAKRILQVKNELESIAKKVNDPLEIVPGKDKVFVFIGKPPKQFGIFWIQNGRVQNFKSLAEEKQISPMTFQLASEELREAYKNNESEEKFSSAVLNRKITVFPSDSLANEVDRILVKLEG